MQKNGGVGPSFKSAAFFNLKKQEANARAAAAAANAETTGKEPTSSLFGQVCDALGRCFYTPKNNKNTKAAGGRRRNRRATRRTRK